MRGTDTETLAMPTMTETGSGQGAAILQGVTIVPVTRAEIEGHQRGRVKGVARYVRTWN